MYSIYTILIIFGLLCAVCTGLDLINPRHKFIPHLQKKSFNANATILSPRESHYCYINCTYVGFFTDTVKPPVDCSLVNTNGGCFLKAILDYTYSIVTISSISNYYYLDDDGITIDKSESHKTYLAYPSNSKYHLFEYYCTSADGCDWNYAKEIIPKLIAIDYQPLYDSFSTKLFYSGSSSNLTQCYNNLDELITCVYDKCVYEHFDFEITKDKDCYHYYYYDSAFLLAGTAYYTSNSSINSSNYLYFVCNIDKCNGDENVNEIRQIINTQGNRYINYKSYSTSNTSTIFDSIQMQIQYVYIILCFCILYFQNK